LIDREAWDGRVMDVRSLPPALVQCGGAEVLATEARRFRDVASDAGWENVVLEEWADMPHVFQVFDAVAPEGGEAIASVGAFAKRVTRGDD
jgi:acetyl esterase/lipase